MNDSTTRENVFRHPGWAGRIGIATADITPPTGIYARCWGAAKHDVAESIHRSLTLNALVLQADDGTPPLVLVDGDLSWWQTLDTFTEIQQAVLREFALPAENFLFAVAHTHAAPPLVEVDSSVPGGALHQEWLEAVESTVIEVIRGALAASFAGNIAWHVGRCTLAKNRDFPDPDADRILCGFHPDATADDTLVVGRISDERRRMRGVIVNYACHPTTLAWDNRAISPDYLGAMRALIAETTGATAFFLQGASGELAPRHQYVADLDVADRHGRQLAHAVLATLDDMEPAGKELAYQEVVESGAPLAVWRHESATSPQTLQAMRSRVTLPLKDWPSAAELEQARAECPDRALAERLRRKRDIRRILGDATTFELPLWAWKMGDAILVGTMAEAYSILQVELRRRFAGRTLLCMNLVNGSIGYLPPASRYELDLYPVTQTPFGEAALEQLIEGLSGVIQTLIEPSDAGAVPHSPQT